VFENMELFPGSVGSIRHSRKVGKERQVSQLVLSWCRLSVGR
jgi:hypothetical protein